MANQTMSVELKEFLKGDCFHAITYLNNYCQKNRLPYPDYIPCHSTFKFSFHVRLNGVNYPNGSFSMTVKTAKRYAAMEALQNIYRSSHSSGDKVQQSFRQLSSSPVLAHNEAFVLKPLTSPWSSVVARDGRGGGVGAGFSKTKTVNAENDIGTNSVERKCTKPSPKLRKIANLFFNEMVASNPENAESKKDKGNRDSSKQIFDHHGDVNENHHFFELEPEELD